MLVKTYFERLYPHIRTAVYYPSRKNSGIFVTLCFCAAGSNHFPFTKGKRYTSEDVPLQRKIYDGTRTMTVCAGHWRFSSGRLLRAIPMRLTILLRWSTGSSSQRQRKKRQKNTIRHRCYIQETRYISSRSLDRLTR